jgi:hypothetical protein
MSGPTDTDDGTEPTTTGGTGAPAPDGAPGGVPDSGHEQVGRPASGDGHPGRPAPEDRRRSPAAPVAGARTQGQRQASGGTTVGDELRRPGVIAGLKPFVGTYAVLGVGVGATGPLAMAVAGDALGRGAMAVAAIVGVLLLGVGLAALLSLQFGDRVDATPAAVAAGSALASAVGVFLLGLVALVPIAAASNGWVDLGPPLASVFATAVPAALVGACGGYLGKNASV